MTLLALGINHRTASVAVREQVAFTPTQLETALAELRNLPQISEAAVLSIGSDAFITYASMS